jgi:hypothetical protein
MSLVISKVFTYDTDAGNYIQAVRQAINNFVVGCKQDGIWSAIKASCILAGARTLNGALVPLAGTAPTSFNFVAGDYNRKTGLKGNASTKYLNTNRAASSQPQNSQHFAVFGSELDFLVTGSVYIGSYGTSSTPKNAAIFSLSSNDFYFNNQLALAAQNQTSTAFGVMSTTGFAGSSRSGANLTTGRRNRISLIDSTASGAPSSDAFYVFATNIGGTASAYSSARLAFYSIGEALDLARLDARVTDLITAFGAAIP